MAGASFSKLSVNLRVIVGSTAVRLPVASEGTPGRTAASHINLGPNIIYVGGTNAVTAGGVGTAGKGFPVNVGESLPLEMGGTEVWAITVSGTADVRILEAI